jgi:hypothetical protein
MRRSIFMYVPLFTLAVFTGITVSVLGQPYDPAVFTLHKLISIGAIVLAVIFIRRQIKETGITSPVRVSIIVLSISALTLLASGALMSVGIKDGIIRMVHTIAPIPAAAAIILINITFRRKLQEKTFSPEA